MFRSISFMGLCIVMVLGWAMSCRADLSGPVEPVGRAPAETGWRDQTVTAGLMRPWAAVWLPDQRTMLVTEREGRLRVIENGRLRGDEVEGLPDILAQGQGGLMDLVLHPEFEKNRLIYFTHSVGNNRANRTVLTRARINDDLTKLEDVETIFQVNDAKPGGQHFGSRIVWLPDGTLLLSIGDGGNPPTRLDGELIRERAQNLASHLGKVLRMDADGEAPEDNPFNDDDPDTDPFIWSWGHRNIQGMVRHPTTGELWATEHGSRGGDELNLLEKGKNYGWPEVTYSREYFGPRISEKTTKEGMVDPKAVWTPALAPSGLMVYTGDEFPDWRGDLLAGGLASQQIRRIHLEDGKVVGQTNLQFRERIRWLGQGPDGGIYVLTDEINGRLFRIVPDRDQAENDESGS